MHKRLLLPEPVIFAISTILKAGGEAWLVGGALRDIILGRHISDFDIATSLKPDEIEKLFSNFKTFNTGKRFGTITVIIDSLHLEITTFRNEKGYSDYRHPDTVEFISNIKDDLSRRDFTINAIAYNPVTSVLIDPFEGTNSIKERLIKTVNNPVDRFNEDPLRMIRAIRFASQLGFSIESATYMAIKKLCFMINKVSVERIREEIFKILESAKADNGMRLLDNTGILGIIINSSLKSQTIQPDIIQRANSSANNEKQKMGMKSGQFKTDLSHNNDYSFIKDCAADIGLRLSAVFYYIFERKHYCYVYDDSKPPDNTIADYIRSVLKHLKCDNNLIKRSLKLVNAFCFFINNEPIACNIRKLIGITGRDDICIFLEWYKAYSNFLSEKYGVKPMIANIERIFYMAEKIIHDNEPVCKQDLAVNGFDIIKLGIGINNKKKIGEALKTALEWVLHDPSCNQKDILMNRLAAKYLNKRNDSNDYN